MQVSLTLPTKAQILSGGFQVHTAPFGKSWKKEQLGAYADLKGVYIHHCNGKILYVGKATTGKHGIFGERLRREFQEKASNKSELYKLLHKQKKPIFAYCLDYEDLDMLVDPGSMSLSTERKALIMEQVLIGIYEPAGNKS